MEGVTLDQENDAKSRIFQFQRMSVGEFADYQCSQGERIVKIGDMYWRRVRLLLYRPLLIFREYSPDSIRAPLLAYLGGFQFAVASGAQSNSFLNLMVYQNVENYSVQSLERQKRQQVRSADAQFIIRPIEKIMEFKQNAYPIYQSFYQRTCYNYKPVRRTRNFFSRWADTLYQFPKVLILGAYHEGELVAVSISELVEDTLIYSTAFSNNDAMRRHVTSLLLHKLLESAAHCPGVKNIYVGPYKYQGRIGVDKFHLERNCTLLSKPAMLRLNPLARICLRRFSGSDYQRLYGQMKPDLRPKN